jgi:probable HAF family extracellular repeat protein
MKLPGPAATVGGGSISGDGSVIVGTATAASVERAFRWREGVDIVYLADLGATSGTVSRGTGVSRNGSVIAGYCVESKDGFPSAQAVVWTDPTQVTPLGDLPGYWSSEPTAIDADGSTVVGRLNSGDGSFAMGFIWDQANGMREFEPFLTSLGIDLTGWTFIHPSCLSDDGLRIIGHGIHNGKTEGFVAVVPEPGAVAACAAFTITHCARRNRRRRERRS